MYVWKSILVILFFMALVAISGWLVVLCVKAHRNHTATPDQYSITVFAVLLTLCLIAGLWKYTYPFERPVETKLVAVLEISEERTLTSPDDMSWHAAYEPYGLLPGSLYFEVDETESSLGFTWPEMDFENYTYIITYGQKIESLSYNVWEIIDAPLRTGAYAGHMVLDSYFEPNEVYVYQIQKMRIDNAR